MGSGSGKHPVVEHKGAVLRSLVVFLPTSVESAAFTQYDFANLYHA
jgi:hypothetical protein